MINRIKHSLFLFLFALVSLECFGAESERLSTADSLFEAQMYTEAFAIYEEYMSMGKFTSSMLLKMAFIQDASEDYVSALYYLNLYYRTSADRLAIGQMEELADEYGLQGYRYTDIDYFLALYQKFRTPIVLLFLSLVLLFTALIYKNYRRDEKAYLSFAFQLISIVILMVFLYLPQKHEAIIVDDQTLLRTGPSAGAEPVELISKGHKVTIVEETNIWSMIIWEGSEVYVRTSRLRSI